MTEQQIKQAIAAAAEQVEARLADVEGYYYAGGEWDADTPEELTDLIVTCWREQERDAQVRL